MAMDSPYRADVERILSHRKDQGGDLWTTPDRRLIKGSPFSTLAMKSGMPVPATARGLMPNGNWWMSAWLVTNPIA